MLTLPAIPLSNFATGPVLRDTILMISVEGTKRAPMVLHGQAIFRKIPASMLVLISILFKLEPLSRALALQAATKS